MTSKLFGGISMRKMIRILFFSVLILFFLNGCSSNEGVEQEDLFQFKDSFVGDAGAVGNITRQLPKPNGEQISGLELKTTEEPYGIILNYGTAEKSADIETNYQELALYNATFILSLIKNAEWVTFNFNQHVFNISREDLETFYGKDLREFTSEDELSMFIQKNLEDEDKVSQFFN